MANVCYPRSAVHIYADVTLFGHPGLSRVQSDPNSYVYPLRPGVRRKRSLSVDSRCYCIGCPREGYKEFFPPAIHFVPVTLCESTAQDLAVLVQEGRIQVAQSLKQLGRTFNVGEKEGDRPSR
jgi:hypothetical protein